MSYGTGPAPYGGQAPYGGPTPYPGGPAPYGAPNQFGQFGPPPLTPDIAPLPGASFGEAVKRYFQRYAQFRGYASRSEYWWVVLFNGLIGLGLYVLLFMVIGLGGALGGSSDDVGTGTGIGMIVVMLLYFAYAIAIFIPSLAIAVRRLHDNGKSGLWLLIAFVPGGSIVLLVFFCLESRPDLYRPEWS
ncbi:DUF805 domain-containing protein [Actinomyces oris]|uniref:DUF805 domain-containing protein n=1 Tax=Actinomyces oris TaxID=544580 RepID=A0A1Q8WWU2_9ACTO|nr:DUF805 domain-containing protein [Actinomyces oris]OLO72524.1 DUF805 domain-containing protein [Actinomyces oris]